jgi:hypothetical protein
MDVELDVLCHEGYDKVEIYRGDELISTLNVSDVVTLSGLSAGSYKARLVGSERVSDFCYWIVADAQSNATPLIESGCVEVSFSATNAKPQFIIWQGADANGTKHIQFLTENESLSGNAIGKFDSGDYKIRVAFETEYGIIFSVLPESITVP